MELEFVKEGAKHFEDFAKWFDREDRYERLKLALKLLDSYLGLSEPDTYLLDLYDSDIRFRIVFDKLYSFNRNISKKLINHKLQLLFSDIIEIKFYKDDDSFALNLIDDYRMVYGAPMYKEVFTNDMREFFTTRRIKKWLN